MASVLVVDDEPSVRRVFQRALQKRGHRVEVAESAEHAAASLDRGRFDLVMTDLVLPGMDGLALTQVVKERLPDIPVILVSGEPPSDSVDAARRAGVAKFLIKPLLPSQVARAVDEILGLD